MISVSTGRIDGHGSPLSGNVLAQTGNIVVRDDGTTDQWLPLTASITLDSTDLKNSAFASAWDDIVLQPRRPAPGSPDVGCWSVVSTGRRNTYLEQKR